MNCISQDNCNTSTLTLNHQKLKVQSATPKEFVARDGPFVQTVEDALQNCGVQRQAYHGGSFVGNHVHACLKVGPTHIHFTHAFPCQLYTMIQLQTQNINQLTEAVMATATKYGTLQAEAKTVQTAFKKLFTLFAKCHDVYSRVKPMSDAEIDHFSK